MRAILFYILFLCTAFQAFSEKDIQVVSKEKFDNEGVFSIVKSDKWLFKSGYNKAWSDTSMKVSDWQPLSPSEISSKMADKNGRVEGWFRLKFMLDSTMVGVPLWLNKQTWAAAEIYLDGRLIQICGNTGINGQPFTEQVRQAYRPSLAIQLIPNQTHQLSIHIVDYPNKWQPYLIFLKYDNLLRFVDSNYIKRLADIGKKELNFKTFWLSVDGILALLLLLLSFVEFNEERLIRSLMTTVIFSVLYVFTWFLISFDCSYNQLLLLSLTADFASWALRVFSLLVLFEIIGSYPSQRIVALLLLLGIVFAWGVEFTNYTLQIGVITSILTILCLVYVIIVAVRKYIGVLWLIIIGISIGHLILCTELVLILLKIPYSIFFFYTIMILPVPLTFIIYLTIRIKGMIREIKENARRLIQVSEEKQQILSNQNEMLEKQVEARTAELIASQNQLIQKEKLASLGELTAGIAHEIQNPLNFVNNFSELSIGITEDLKEEINRPELDKEYIDELLTDLGQNQEKINHHGKRASSIVKGMLEHSRASTGERQSTDINALCDEYLRLSFHGLRAKNKDFNSEFRTEFDENLPKIEVVSQDIGRVLLNLLNNAFYAINQRNATKLQMEYKPTVIVSTKKIGNDIEIKVQDNGGGISENIKVKIFQPFFTTKPTGEGTGLGLSLSYDIITKGHGGTIECKSVEGEGTTFIIKLPI
ncbi:MULTISPECIES: sensor histidine kinase [Emticicia]|uniref:sensor histidine kinase n=1 Tax=Emticicia TaxID=312278 RepID=UPI0007D89F31|nr:MULTISPECIES: ATP-binding protein [Emticicia]